MVNYTLRQSANVPTFQTLVPNLAALESSGIADGEREHTRHDTHIPLIPEAVYSWSQGESAWHDLSGADLVDLLESNKPPAFKTVLGRLDDQFVGPFYVDLDVNEEDGGIEVAIVQLNTLLGKLEAANVDLDCVRLFATGGRGFHIEIPEAIFNGKPHEQLPAIYKAMAMELFVDGVDCRVYSSGRGRQWRVPNIQRSNGSYKVPITPDEARNLTVESYRTLCSEPRGFPPLKEATLATGLALLWGKARDRLKSKPIKRTFTRAEAEMRQRFAVEVGPSIRATLSGAFLPDQGWNQIALQLALLAHALGWDDDRLVAEAAGLIARHESDGRRYATRFAREAELRRQFHYVDGNAAYDFTLAGLCSILRPGHKPELQGLEADQPEDAPNYAELIDTASDCTAVVEIARRVNTDAALTRTEATSLIKRAAKSVGVPIATLKSDLYDPEDTSGLFVQVTRHDFAASVLSCKAVLPHVPGLRQRAGELVEVHGARIAKVDLAHLGFLVSTVAKWRYPDGIGAPDGMVLQAVMSAGCWPGVPELLGVAHQPALLADGTVGAPQGYEPQYRPDDFALYDGSPAEALAELRGLLSEFPFATARDEAAALAGILTAVARPMLRTAPAFLVTANEAGVGKGCLSDLISLFASEDTSPISWPGGRTEQGKTLSAALWSGRPVLYFDNLRSGSVWNGEMICSILTEPMADGRILGASDMKPVSTKVLVIANGNNVSAGGDLTRRIIKIEMVATEGTVTRRFTGVDPRVAVRADRSRWVMTALRALQGDRAVDLLPMASFNEWSALVRGVLVGAGLPDVLQGVVDAVQADDDRATLGFLLEVWSERFGGDPLTLRDAWRTVANFVHDELHVLLLDIAGKGDGLDLTRAGYWFRANAGRSVGGRKLVQLGKTRKGIAWAVV